MKKTFTTTLLISVLFFLSGEETTKMADNTSTLKELLSVITNLQTQVAQAQTQVSSLTALAAQAATKVQAAITAAETPVPTPTPTPVATLTPSAVTLNANSLELGKDLEGTATFKNDSDKAVTLQALIVAFRAPGATHSGGPFTDGTPTLASQSVAPGATVSLKATRSFAASDTVGTWEAYATAQVDGAWKDGKSTNFTVKAAAVVTPPPPTPTDPTPNPGNGQFVFPGGKFYLGTQAGYITSWSGSKIFKDNINWATAYASGADVWNPQYLADFKGYGVFRHMDTNSVNFSKISKWSQRKLPTDPQNNNLYIDSNSPASQTGMALEWQIDFVNKAQVNGWFTHPYLADDDYIRQQATMIKAKMDPKLRIYIELSNEVWNGGFTSAQQAIDAGLAGGLPGSNKWYQGIAHEMKRALEMYQIYEEVFGKDQMGTRVVRVFSESGNLDLTTQALANVYTSSKWNPKSQKIDMLALAPYVGNGWDGAAFNMAQWKTDIDNKVKGEPIAQAKSQMAKYGIKYLGSYEFGNHQLKNAKAFVSSPAAYDAYTYMLEAWSKNFNEACCAYTLHGVWGDMAFGAFNTTGQDINQAPKAKALRDFINSHK